MNYPLHTMNRTFSWQDHSGPYDILSEEQVENFDQQGFFVFKNAFSTIEIEDIINAIDPFEKEAEAYLRTQKDNKIFISKADAITFVPHIVNRSESAKRFASHPVLAGIAKDLMGDNVRLYWDQSVYKKPGNPKHFPYHQDNGYTFIEPQTYLTCWIPLVDVDENNGCPWVVPGLHRLGTLDHKITGLGFEIFSDHHEQVAVPAKAGDIVVFSSLTPHKTGPNLTDKTRKSYILQYAPEGILRKQSIDDDGELQDDEDRQFFVVRNGELV